jgi:hypothetical protein
MLDGGLSWQRLPTIRTVFLYVNENVASDIRVPQMFLPSYGWQRPYTVCRTQSVEHRQHFKTNRTDGSALVLLVPVLPTRLQILGACAELLKAIISFVLSVCPSVRSHGTRGSHWTDCH